MVQKEDCLEIIRPTTQEENPTVNDVASCYRYCSYITNPSYSLMSGDVTLEDNPSYNTIYLHKIINFLDSYVCIYILHVAAIIIDF